VNYHPEDLDVVWCSFPYTSELLPGEKSRPCLVVGRESNIIFGDGETYLYVVYGTSKIDRSAEYSVLVDDTFSMSDAGLLCPTRFRFKNIALLAFNKDYFPNVPAINGRPAKENCRLGVMNEKGRRGMIRVFKEMKANGINLDDLFIASRKNTMKAKIF